MKKFFSFLGKTVLLILLLLLLLHIVHYFWNRDISNPPHGYPSLTFIKAAAILGFEKLVNRNPDIPEDIREIKNIEYKNINGISLQLDIYRQKNLTELRPCLLFIHGGAWKTGKRSDYLVYLLDFAKRGYITATVTYRLSKVAPFPAAVEDVKCAVKWLKSNATEYRINPEKIAVLGGSAGGHLALMVGYSPEFANSETDCKKDTADSRVQAVVDIYGPVDLTTDFALNSSAVKEFLVADYEENPEIYLQASPKTYISADDPPTMILHGTIDEIVPIGQSDSLKVWLDQAGVENEYHRLPGWPHAMDVVQSVNDYFQYHITSFLHKHLPIHN